MYGFYSYIVYAICLYTQISSPTIYVRVLFVLFFVFLLFPNFTIYSNIFIIALDDTRIYTFVMLCYVKQKRFSLEKKK